MASPYGSSKSSGSSVPSESSAVDSSSAEGLVPGCTFAASTNYNSAATFDDGSCITCASMGLCVLGDTDSDDNCNSVGNGCCDEFCLTLGDCSPSFATPFTAANGVYYPSCYG